MKKIVGIFCLIFVLFIQCSQTNKYQHINSRVQKNREKIDSLYIQLIKTQKNIDRVNDLLEEKTENIQTKLDTREITNSKLSILEQSITTLRAKIEQQEKTIAKLNKADTSYTYPAIENMTPEQIYHQALELYEDKNYQKSIDKFSLFLHYYPEDNLAQNAQYWIGECYYCLDQNQTAIFNFDKVIQNYSFSNKTVDAKLKIALCLIGMKEYQGALTQLNEIKANHPGYNKLNIVKEKIGWLENQ